MKGGFHANTPQLNPKKLVAHCLDKVCKDICQIVFNSNTNRFVDRDISKLDELHEKEKRRLYNERITEIERGSCTQLLMSTTN